MSQFEIVTSQTPGVITFSNYEEVKKAVMEYVSSFSEIDYSVEGAELAKKNSKEIKAKKDAIAKAKKEIEAVYSAPYKEVESKLDELVKLLDKPYKEAKTFADEQEKNDKETIIHDYAEKKAADLEEIGKKIIASKAFLNPKWLNKTTNIKTVYDEIDGIINRASNDIKLIQSTAGEQSGILLARYFETLSMDGMDIFLENVRLGDSEDALAETESDSGVKGYKVLKITATEDQMAFIMSQLDMLGVEVEEIEDGMPKPMEELTSPDFDSFVAFDIETTGTYGAANGDEEAKITEIGAVKIENGVVVARFDELANPGRNIVPRIAAITHITDDMVADKPSVDEVIRMFKDFAGDSVLVGHNIKSSDLRYITKAAKAAGVNFDNAFLDTYILSKNFKEKKGWEKLNLGYLSNYYGLEHKEAHRAWSDAEVNAQVYFELKKMNEE